MLRSHSENDFGLLINKLNKSFQDKIFAGKNGELEFAIGNEAEVMLADGQLTQLAGTVSKNQQIASNRGVKISVKLHLCQTRFSEFDIFLLGMIPNCELQIGYDLKEVPNTFSRAALKNNIKLVEINRMTRVTEVGQTLFYPSPIVSAKPADLVNVCKQSLEKLGVYIKELKSVYDVIKEGYSGLHQSSLKLKPTDDLAVSNFIDGYVKLLNETKGMLPADFNKKTYCASLKKKGIIDNVRLAILDESKEYLACFDTEIKQCQKLVKELRNISDSNNPVDQSASMFCLVTTMNAAVGENEKTMRSGTFTNPHSMLGKLTTHGIDVMETLAQDLSACMPKKFALIQKFLSYAAAISGKMDVNTLAGAAVNINLKLFIDFVLKYILFNEAALQQLQTSQDQERSVEALFNDLMKKLTGVYDALLLAHERARVQVEKTKFNQAQDVKVTKDRYYDFYIKVDQLFTQFFALLDKLKVKYSIDDMLQYESHVANFEINEYKHAKFNEARCKEYGSKTLDKLSTLFDAANQCLILYQKATIAVVLDSEGKLFPVSDLVDDVSVLDANFFGRLFARSQAGQSSSAPDASAPIDRDSLVRSPRLAAKKSSETKQ